MRLLLTTFTLTSRSASGLLQTYQYAEALLRALGNSQSQVQRKLEVRTQRQRLWYETQHPTLDYILGEAALLRPVGSQDAMIEQFSHLLDLSQRDDIDLWLLRRLRPPGDG